MAKFNEGDIVCWELDPTFKIRIYYIDEKIFYGKVIESSESELPVGHFSGDWSIDKFNIVESFYKINTSLLDDFAGRAMQGYIANEGIPNDMIFISELCYGMASAMIVTREKHFLTTKPTTDEQI